MVEISIGILEILFLLVLGFSLVGIFLSIPGNFLIVLDTLWYGLATHFKRYHFSFVLTLILIAVGVELLEYLVIAFGKRGYTANRILAVGAVVGGILGVISGAFFSPVLGSVIGGFLGVLLSTILVELIIRGRSLREASHSLLGALIGRLGPLTIKAIGTLTMSIIVAVKMFT